MSSTLREALIRTGVVLLSIFGAVFVFFVINDVREGTFNLIAVITAILTVIALVWLNRWWYQRTGTRI